mgnify:CR=1 FL=1
MGRPSGEKTRNSGNWTEAKFRSFITNQLRGATRKWGPIQEVKKEANVSRGMYKCRNCKREVPLTIKQGNKRTKNVFVDHIKPIVDPEKGFTTFDEYIERMFCEKDNLQVLCGDCHDEKSLKERELAAKARKEGKRK